jgi:hypothetical protein
MMLAGASAARAQAVPSRIPVQGVLTDSSGNPVDGQVTIELQLYTVQSGGTSVFDETQQVNVDKGAFTVGRPQPPVARQLQELELGRHRPGAGPPLPLQAGTSVFLELGTAVAYYTSAVPDHHHSVNPPATTSTAATTSQVISYVQ